MSSPVHTFAPASGITVIRPGVSTTDLLLVLMALIWGVNIAVVKYGTIHLSPLAYNGVRVAIAAIALLAIGASLRERWPARRDVLVLLMLGTLGNGLYQLFFIQGVAHTRAGNAALVLAATPAFVALVGWLRGVERIRPRAMLGIAVSIAGMAIVVVGTAPLGVAEETLVGDLLVLSGCICWALFTVLLNPYAKRVNAIHVSAITMTGGAIPLLLVGAPAMARTDWLAVPGKVWAAIVFSGLGALVIAYLCWYRGIKVLGPTRTSMYGNLQPIVALLFAWILLHEVPTVLQGIGAASIITGLLMTRA